MKKYNPVTSLLELALIFSSDLCAGKSKKKNDKHSYGTVSRKAPPSKVEEMALVPFAPAPPSSTLIPTGGKEENTVKKDKKRKGVLSIAKGAKELLKTGASTLKNAAMGQPLSDQVLKFGREGLRSVALGKPSPFLSAEMRLLQSVVLRNVPLDQKAKAIGGQRESYKGVSLLAERRGAAVEEELKSKANAGLARRHAFQSILEKSEVPQRKALLEELKRAVSARNEKVEGSSQVSQSQLMEQSWIDVRPEVSTNSATTPSQTSFCGE